MKIEPILPTSLPGAKPEAKAAEMKKAAVEFEAAFLAEMLKSSGLGKTGAMGGGVGEDQFSSFLVTEQARAIAQSGGLGIAEMVLKSLEARNG